MVASLLPRRRGLAISLLSAAYSFGGFVGPSSAGYLLAYHGWDSPFIALALIGGAFLVFFAALLGSSARAEVARPIAYREALKNRAIVVLAVADFFADLGFLVFVSWTPKYLISTFSVSGTGTTTVDSLFGIGVGLGGLGALAAGLLFDRIGGRRSVLLCGGLSALSFVALYVATPLSLALVLVLVAGFFSNTFWPLMTAMAQVSAANGQVTSATSVVQTAGFIGAFIGPALAGFIGGAVSSALILSTVVPYVVFLLVITTMYRGPASAAGDGGINPQRQRPDRDQRREDEGVGGSPAVRLQQRGDGRAKAVLEGDHPRHEHGVEDKTSSEGPQEQDYGPGDREHEDQRIDGVHAGEA